MKSELKINNVLDGRGLYKSYLSLPVVLDVCNVIKAFSIFFKNLFIWNIHIGITCR